MKHIKDVSKHVEGVLRKYPSTRDSDPLLYIRVLEEYTPTIRDMKFATVFERLNDLGLPKPESVRRSRQYLQSRYPELRSSIQVERGKKEAMEEVLDYVSK